MAYHLGVDLGTTYTAAAIAQDGRVEAVTLGHGTTVPSVVFLDDDGEMVIGTAAQLRASTDPSRVVREFKRRVGDPVPILAGNSPVPAEQLMARVLDWVVTEVATAEGEPPAGLAVTHPANWGLYKREMLQGAIRAIPLHVDHLVPEPVAAATFYAARRDLPLGTVVAVYDLGGGTFDVAVVRSEPEGFRIIGQPDGIERLGGIDFDHAVLRHVARAAGMDLDALDPDADPAVTLAVTRLRQECVAAKESLSTEADVTVPVTLPDRYTEVRLTRAHFEAMIRPALDETIVALRRAIGSAGVVPHEVTAVLLVGGSSRIPLVARLVTAELGRPVAVDARPKDATSMGAALLAERIPTPAVAAPPPAPPSPQLTTPAEGPPQLAAPGPAPAPPVPPALGVPLPAPAVHHPPPPFPPPPRRRPPVRAAVVAGIALVGVIVGALVLQMDSGDVEGGGAEGAGSEPAGSSDGVAVEIPDAAPALVSAGLDHACALMAEGGATPAEVSCWGLDDFDETSPPPEPLDVVDVGVDVSCGIRFEDTPTEQYAVPSGVIVCWGDTVSGHSDSRDQASPPSSPGFFALSVGDHHGCAIRAPEAEPGLELPDDDVPSGAVNCWGDNDAGQARLASEAELGGVPVPIGNEYIAVSAGGSHTCGLNTEGGGGILVVCWGDDTFGQSSPPEQDPNTDQPPFYSISAGRRHTCGLRTDNTVICWGEDEVGQASPPPGERLRSISAGGGFTCGIRMDGTVTCWGFESVVEEVPPGQFTSIGSGDQSACGVRTDGTIACWGIGSAANGPAAP